MSRRQSKRRQTMFESPESKKKRLSFMSDSVTPRLSIETPLVDNLEYIEASVNGQNSMVDSYDSQSYMDQISVSPKVSTRKSTSRKSTAKSSDRRVSLSVPKNERNNEEISSSAQIASPLKDAGDFTQGSSSRRMSWSQEVYKLIQSPFQSFTEYNTNTTPDEESYRSNTNTRVSTPKTLTKTPGSANKRRSSSAARNTPTEIVDKIDTNVIKTPTVNAHSSEIKAPKSPFVRAIEAVKPWPITKILAIIFVVLLIQQKLESIFPKVKRSSNVTNKVKSLVTSKDFIRTLDDVDKRINAFEYTISSFDLHIARLNEINEQFDALDLSINQSIQDITKQSAYIDEQSVKRLNVEIKNVNSVLDHSSTAIDQISQKLLEQ